MKSTQFFAPVAWITIAIATQFGPANAATWESIGPAGVPISNQTTYAGRVSDLQVYSNGDVVIASAGGGIWHYSTTKRTWAPGDTKGILSFGALASAPTNPSILYAVSGEGHACGDCFAGRGLFRSTDGGGSWTITENNAGLPSPKDTSPVHFASQIAVDPRDANHIWVSGDTGLWEGWFSVYQPKWAWRQLFSCSSADFAPQDPCATSVIVDPTDHKVIYAANDAGILRFTSDAQGAVTVDYVDLTSLGMPRADQSYRIAITAGGAPSRRFYASIGYRGVTAPGCLAGVLWSGDGAQWHRSEALPDYFWADYAYGGPTPPPGQCTSGQAWYDNAVAVNPNNVNDVSVGGVNVMRSIDAGAHWTDVTKKYSLHPDVHALRYGPDGLYIASDGGIDLIGSDGQHTLATGLPIMEFYQGGSYLPGKSLYVGSQDNGTNQLAAIGQNPSVWKQILGGDGGATQVDRTNANHIFAEDLVNGTLCMTTDGGSEWTVVAKAAPPQPCFTRGYSLWWPHSAWVLPIKISMATPAGAQHLYVGASDVFGSVDSGHSWYAVSNFSGNTGSNVTAMDISTLPSGGGTRDLLVAGWSDGALRSHLDGQLSWHDLTPALNGSSLGVADIGIDPGDAKRAYVVLNHETGGDLMTRGGYVFRFEDVSRDAKSGDAVDLTGNLACTPYVVRIVQSRAYLGCDDGVYTLDETGNAARWVPFGDGLPGAVVYDIITVQGGIVAVTHGRGLWRIPTP